MIFDMFSNKQEKRTEPDFVTGSQFSFYLEKMLNEATQFITIVSPYIRFSQRIYDCLQQKKNSGVKITIIYREAFTHSDIAQSLYQRSNLHAKCYLTEKALILGSMNLYDVSQTNNDEFGILFSKADYPTTYEKVYAEIERLSYSYNGKNVSNTQQPVQMNLTSASAFLEKNRKYTQDELKKYFNFTGKLYGGINRINDNTILLIWRSNSRYNNRYQNGIVYYMGQDTGGFEQELIYGNKLLYDAYNNSDKHIHLIKDDVYCGECYVCEKPYLENGKWIFPLKAIIDNERANKCDVEIKVGKLARTVLRELLESGKIEDSEILKFQTVEYSKKVFGISFALLLLDTGQIKTPDRYYKDKLTINNKKYFLTSEWYSKNLYNLKEWIEKHSTN